MSSLGVSANGPIGPGGTTWIAHTPYAGDWFAFNDPVGGQNPFALDGDGLSITVRKNGNPNNGFDGYTGGLLASVDGHGNGFAQQYGYFEVSMKTPGGPNTWPAFWLLSRNGLVEPDIDVAEIDVTESYGNYGAGPNNRPAGDPNHSVAGWHGWGSDGTPTGDGFTSDVAGLTTGYHTYGVDVEPTGLTYYVDRRVVWTAPIYEAARHPMYVLLDLALGGGNFNNAGGTGFDWNLTPSGSALSVRYVAVWASPASPNYDPALSARVPGVTIGTPGSWLTGDTGVYTATDGAGAAFDGDLSTAFNAPASTNGQNAWTGLDLGAAKVVTEISFAPRAGYADRMAGGKFQASSTADFSSGVLDLYWVPAAPASGTQTVAVNSGTPYRYVRYLSPSGGWGNVAEVSFKALAAPAVVSGVVAKALTGSQVSVAWTPTSGATAFDVYRGTTPGGEGAVPLAANVTAATYVDATVKPNYDYYYFVTASNPAGVGGASAEVTVTPTGAATALLPGTVIGTTGSWSSGDSGLLTADDGAGAAYDGDTDTSFDAPASTGGTGAWAGLDLGAPRRITEIRFTPRPDFGQRMTGGRFQASSTPDFSAGVVDLYTITATPAFAAHTVSVDSGGGYRYVRYLSPTAGWGNVAEIVFRGASLTPTRPPRHPIRPTPTPTRRLPPSRTAVLLTTARVQSRLIEPRSLADDLFGPAAADRQDD